MRRQRALWVAAAVVAAGVWLASGWPVGGVLAGLAVIGVPWLLAQFSGGNAAVERLEAGADLLQAYTAFVYEGPWWPVRVNAGVREHLQDGADQVSNGGEGR